jgi:hypothetical protein
MMPMVAGPMGYEPHLEVYLDNVAVSSTLNDIRLVAAESCRVSTPSFLVLDNLLTRPRRSVGYLALR